MSTSKTKKERKRNRARDEEDELGIDPPDSPFEERQMESPSHQQEDDETSPIQPATDVGRAPEVGLFPYTIYYILYHGTDLWF